jgi:bidirectional [NiFe] hydrogenase diaphorase subunit
MPTATGSDYAKPVPPDGQDKRWRIVDATMRRLGRQSRSLIETLHTVQEAFGYLDEGALRYVATSLHMSHEPRLWRRHLLSILHLEAGRPAHLRGLHGNGLLYQGRAALLTAMANDYGIAPGETTSDGKYLC